MAPDFWSLLLDIILLMGGALVMGGLCSRLGQSPIVGYLVAGMLLGPGSFGVIGAEDQLATISELGVSLLLFAIGLEFSWKRLLRLGGPVLGAGVLQVAITVVVATVIALPFMDTRAAIAVGAMLALSSTACVLRILMERAELDSPHGRAALAVLLVQDMAVLPLALLVTLLGAEGEPAEIARSVGWTLLEAVGLIVGLYLLLNQAATRVLSRLNAGSGTNRELIIILGALVGLGSAWAAHKVGLSPAMGAFVAGLALAGSPFAMQMRADISPLRVLLLTLFFAAAGMIADPMWILQNLHIVLLTTVVILIGKTAIVAGIFRGIRRPASNAVATGLCLSQIGEFAFVLGGIATAAGVVSEDVISLIVSCTLLTLLVTPFLVPASPGIGQWVAERLGAAVTEPANTPADYHPEVVIVGFGPAGRRAGEVVSRMSCRALVLDLNPAAQRDAEALGLAFELGDASSREVLDHVISSSLKLVVITIPSPTAAMFVLDQVRRLSPTAEIVVRSRYDLHRHDFESAGAGLVVVDETEAGDRLAAGLRSRIAASDRTG